MNFLSTSMHVLFWWYGLPGWWIACCKYRREGEIRGHQIPLYLRWITFCNNKEHSLKEPRTLVLGFVLLSWSYTWKSSISSFFLVAAEAMLRCQYCWGYWSGGWLSIVQSHFLPPSIFFLTAALFMLISKCVSAAVLTPACCQGQTRKEAGFDGEPLDKKHPLMEHYAAWKWLVDLLHFGRTETVAMLQMLQITCAQRWKIGCLLCHLYSLPAGDCVVALY